MPQPADSSAAPGTAAKGLNWIMIGLVGLLALAAAAGGAAVPLLLFPVGPKGNPATGADAKSTPALLTFGDAVVNLAEGRATRYLKVKLILVVNGAHETKVNDLLQKEKPFLKSWLLSHLADRTLDEVIGKAAQNRLRREIRDEFNARLFPDGSELITDILFEEFVVQ